MPRASLAVQWLRLQTYTAEGMGLILVRVQDVAYIYTHICHMYIHIYTHKYIIYIYIYTHTQRRCLIKFEFQIIHIVFKISMSQILLGAYLKLLIVGNLLLWLRELKLGLCNNLEEWKRVAGGRKVKRERTYVHLWQIYADVWQKSNQYCKVIILQLKINFKINE